MNISKINERVQSFAKDYNIKEFDLLILLGDMAYALDMTIECNAIKHDQDVREENDVQT